jgi:hypothetical protein
MNLHRENPIGLTVGKGLEQDVLNHAEYGGRGSYAKAQSDDSHRDEARLFPETAQTVTDILSHADHDRSRRDFGRRSSAENARN